MKVISGGQNGVDQAALAAAKSLGIATGGIMPKGWKTLDGPRPEFRELYGMVESKYADYPTRTFGNVHDADVTVRIARFFHSPGEQCTLQAIQKYDRPSTNIVWGRDGFETHPSYLANFLRAFSPDVIVNIAGNAEPTAPGIGKAAYIYLVQALMEFAP